MTTRIRIGDMTCQNCVRHVREAIQSLPDVDSVTVVLEKAEAVVRWKGQAISEGDLIKCLDAAGYPSQVIKAA